MGLIKKKILVYEEAVLDIICDSCGESTRDSLGINFEYAEIKATWGYGSNNKDGEEHQSFLCEKCYEKMLKLMNLNPIIRDYLT